MYIDIFSFFVALILNYMSIRSWCDLLSTISEYLISIIINFVIVFTYVLAVSIVQQFDELEIF